MSGNEALGPSPTTRPFPEPGWEPTSWTGDAWDLPLYSDGYLAGWRDAMTDAKGGDWSASFPIWWPEPPATTPLPPAAAAGGGKQP